MRKVFLPAVLFCLLLADHTARAQEEFIEPPARTLSKFRFKVLTGGVVMVNARLNNFPDSLNFILDTGSGGISLDSATADYFKLQPQPTNRMIRGIAGTRYVSFLYNQQLHFPGLSIDSLNFHVSDYEILTSVYGEKIDGIIGYSVFSRYIIKINYDSLQVEFLSKGSIKYPRGGYLLEPYLANLPVQPARVRDERAIETRLLYDIGAGLCLIFSRDFVNDSSLIGKKRRFFTKEAEGVGGAGKVDMQMTVIKEFRLGPYRFRTVPVYVFDDVNSITNYPQLGGILGSDLLRRFNIIYNYPRRQFYITPNSHFNEPFDYSYSGVELYAVDGQIIAGDVAEGSPAEKAGLLEGDVIMAINTDFSQNLGQYKIALQNTGELVKILIRRNEELMQVQFKIGNILKRK